jgi:hypothetical protein
MWTTVMCPKCGEKFEINLNEVDDTVVCRFCLENFTLPYHLREQMEEIDAETCLVGEMQTSTRLDSSFWLS